MFWMRSHTFLLALQPCLKISEVYGELPRGYPRDHQSTSAFPEER